MVDLDILHDREILHGAPAEEQAPSNGRVKGRNHALDEPSDGDGKAFDRVFHQGRGPSLVISGNDSFELRDHILLRWFDEN